ncbi:MAG: hypothetical protein U0841_33360 [Chloroflexia bacterium]
MLRRATCPALPLMLLIVYAFGLAVWETTARRWGLRAGDANSSLGCV